MNSVDATRGAALGSTATYYNRIGSYFNQAWWDQLSAEEKTAFGSVSIYRCPTRSGGGTGYAERELGTGNANQFISGPFTDYTIAIHVPRVADGTHSSFEWRHTHAHEPVYRIDNMMGPLRQPVLVDLRNGTQWTPRDTFARWSDGTSNQIVIGEKHVPVTYVGKCSTTDNTPTYNIPGYARGHCSYLNGGHERLATIFCLIRFKDTTRPIATINDPPGYGYNNAFGSMHPGVCNMLLGDGSVRPFAVTTRFAVLDAFSHTSDGVSVSL